MALYPINLRLTNKKVVVVGGGLVAERKVMGLIGTGAEIVVISPEVTKRLEDLAKQVQIQWVPKTFTEEDISLALLIFAATDHPAVNQAIKKAAGPNQLVTIADDPDHSDFHVPGKIQRGKLCLTVSTSGASPTLTQKIRERLEEEFAEQYEQYVEFLDWARRKILIEVEEPRLKKQLLKSIVSNEFLESENRKEKFLKMYIEQKSSL